MGNSNIDNEAQAFEDWCLDKGLSDTSARNYALWLKQLPEPLDFHTQDLEHILAMIKAQVTFPAIRSAYKKYLQFKRDTENYSIDQLKDLDFVRNEIDQIDVASESRLTKTEVMKKYLDTDEVAEFHRKTQDISPPRFKTLDDPQRKCAEFKLLPVFLFETAARIAEALRVTTTDLDFEDGQVTIREGKRGKRRTVDIDKSVTLLQDHITRFDIDGELFLFDREQEYWKLRYEMIRIGNNAALKFGDVTPHWFRHSYATNWCVKELQKGRGIAEVKEEIRDYLGHDDTSTTEVYIHAAEELTRDNIYREHGGFQLSI
ncbi:tyrosine-type recombinase/integrase [Natronorubrum sp. A-ect3]|uniref:tyrosine-type recombinase/integrase n=1 Tax=Natronorubrum sp. A-ect3 TaxID=3242698 RepID=UPI00359D539F